jgi:hypothetical protein
VPNRLCGGGALVHRWRASFRRASAFERETKKAKIYFFALFAEASEAKAFFFSLFFFPFRFFIRRRRATLTLFLHV